VQSDMRRTETFGCMDPGNGTAEQGTLHLMWKTISPFTQESGSCCAWEMGNHPTYCGLLSEGSNRYVENRLSDREVGAPGEHEAHS
jgi:hypothetical protein